MTEIIVDTDVLSFLFKDHPVGRLYDSDVAGRAAGISFMTVADLERWALQYRWSPQRVAGCAFSLSDSPSYPQVRTFASSGPR